MGSIIFWTKWNQVPFGSLFVFPVMVLVFCVPPPSLFSFFPQQVDGGRVEQHPRSGCKCDWCRGVDTTAPTAPLLSLGSHMLGPILVSSQVFII